MKMHWVSFRRAAGAYLAVAAVALMLVVVVLRLWEADLAIPFRSGGDTTFQQVLYKAIAENGWYSPNPSLGMPDGAHLEDFPMPENLYFLVIKLLTLVVRNHVVVYNLFFLLTFPLIALSATAVCRQLKLSWAVSGFVGVLFSFLPYHFFRGQAHPMLSAYYLVPPVVLVCWWLTAEDAVFFPAVGAGRARPRWGTRRGLAGLLICLLAGSTGIYYALFSGFFLLVAGGWAAWARRRLYPALAAFVLTAFLILVVLANSLPSLVNFALHGRNLSAVVRFPAEAEVYGLKIAQLVLPAPHHRVAVLQQLMDRYWKGPLNNENSGAALGFVAAGGFLVLLAGMFRFRSAGRPDAIGELLPRLNLAGVLLGTVGGFGSVVAILAFPAIRGYNRVSIFIGFFALVQVGILLDRLRDRTFRQGPRRFIFAGSLVVLAAAAVADQTSDAFVPHYAEARAGYQVVDAFARRMEAALPPGGMVFQLPYLRFPEDRVNALESYAHLMTYLHTRTLRFSFGAMRGRATDRWQREISLLPVDEFVESVVVAGFSAIYLDRSGYADRGAAVERQLADIIQERPFSLGDSIIVFPVLEWARRYRKGFSDQEWQGKREDVLHPVVFANWGQGFWDPEVQGKRTWRWCSREGTLAMVNVSDRTRQARLDMIVAAGYDTPSHLTVRIGREVETLQVNAAGTPYSKRLTLPPGATEITFSSDAPVVTAKGEARTLVFRIDSFRKQIY